jgi:hypothetical protein
MSELNTREIHSVFMNTQKIAFESLHEHLMSFFNLTGKKGFFKFKRSNRKLEKNCTLRAEL